MGEEGIMYCGKWYILLNTVIAMDHQFLKNENLVKNNKTTCNIIYFEIWEGPQGPYEEPQILSYEKVLVGKYLVETKLKKYSLLEGMAGILPLIWIEAEVLWIF